MPIEDGNSSEYLLGCYIGIFKYFTEILIGRFIFSFLYFQFRIVKNYKRLLYGYLGFVKIKSSVVFQEFAI